MIYDIITLPNSNQAVIVDKTRIPKYKEWYYDPYSPLGTPIGIEQRSSPDNDPLVSYKGCFVILASREPIPGVYLLPEWIWEKERLSALSLAFGAYMKPFFNRDTPIGNERLKNVSWPHFKAGYEAAGGYTREDVFDYPEWLIKNEYFNYKSFDEGMRRSVFEKYLAERSLPRQLDITLNEDGSLPVDEKGVVKVNNVIY